ncbi:MAG TPA: hypothetical protein VMT18_12715 [Planctomycetota bacterium]|nr:hypothetical protein [Planctomycetota bacterium]
MGTTNDDFRPHASRRGSALLYALILMVALAGMCAALLMVTVETGSERQASHASQRSLYAAEAGLNDVLVQMTGTPPVLVVPPGSVVQVGSLDAPIPLGPSAYFVSVSELEPRTYAVDSTGIDGNDTQRLQLLLKQEATGFFQFAAFGSRGVVLNSNSFVDSYDSAFGPYDSQVQGGNDFAKENGDIGSNADIDMKSNTVVHGDVRPGVDGDLNYLGPNIQISGSTDPLEEPFEMPPIDWPAATSTTNLVATTDLTLGPGVVAYNDVLMKGGSKLTLKGPVTFVVENFHMLSNSSLIFDPSGGEIELYAKYDFVLESNADVQSLSESALDVTLFLGGNNIGTKKDPGPDKVELGANAQFIGAIYAPDAQFKLASNFDIFGSIMCGFLDLSSFGTIHFDEALLYDGDGASGELETVLWRRLPGL